jgi:hypothetical protein
MTDLFALSLTAVDEVLAFGGVDHLTISSTLLRELSSTPAPPEYIPPFQSPAAITRSNHDSLLDGLADDEATFRTALRDDKFDST